MEPVETLKQNSGMELGKRKHTVIVCSEIRTTNETGVSRDPSLHRRRYRPWAGGPVRTEAARPPSDRVHDVDESATRMTRSWAGVRGVGICHACHTKESTPPRCPHQSQRTSTHAPPPDSNLSVELLKSLVPALVEDPTSFEEAISSICAAHDVDESVVSALKQAARRGSSSLPLQR